MGADPTHLTRRYVIALFAVALLSLVGQLLVQRALTRHAEDARVINVAGRQRMLSQRLTKTALALPRAPAEAQAEYRADLAADLREWTRTHRGLLQGDRSFGLPPVDSPIIAAMYTRVESIFVEMASATARLIDADGAGDRDRREAALGQLLQLEPGFLAAMNDIVYQFQREADARVGDVQRIELALFALILLTLLAEGFFVFKPAVARILRDLKEHRRLEREILEIGEREQERIGQDIHDDLCQHLVGIRFVAQSLAVRAARGNPIGAVELEGIASLSERALGVASGMARGLCVASLTEDGLGSAIVDLTRQASASHHIRCTHHVRLEDAALPREVALHVYRIAQEGLANALKHSRAACVDVSVWREGSDLVMTVTDDGIGLPEPTARRRGMGLRTMQNRARMIGATLDVERIDGAAFGDGHVAMPLRGEDSVVRGASHGTRIMCRLPNVCEQCP